MNGRDIAATWIVAIALVGAVGAHSALPDLPPGPGYGVEAIMARQALPDPMATLPITCQEQLAENLDDLPPDLADELRAI